MYEKYEIFLGEFMPESDHDSICSVEKMFFGAVTVGERGQVVIPAEARKAFGIDTGDKLLVFGHPSEHGVTLVKIGAVERFVELLRESIERAGHSHSDSPE
jgi:AbrB family looped-hinge helix DNA binding protein